MEQNAIDWPAAPPNPVEKPVYPANIEAIPVNDLIKLYEQTVRWQHQELLRKNYEVRELRDRVQVLHDELTKTRDGQPRSAYEVLLLLANDPSQNAATRLRAAEAIIGYERPKLSATMTQNTNLNIGDRLIASTAAKKAADAARQEAEMDRARRQIAANKPIWPAAVVEGEGA